MRENGWSDWRLASCYEAMARAYAAAGDGAGYEHWAAMAREVIGSLEDEEDRELVARQLASIPQVAPTEREGTAPAAAAR